MYKKIHFKNIFKMLGKHQLYKNSLHQMIS